MPFSSCITTKNVYAKEAKPACYFSHIASKANTDAAQRITNSLKTPRDEETWHLQKQTSRLIATNHNISDVDWLHSLNEDITWIQGDPIQAISQQLNQSKQVGKSISELHIVAHGSNGEIRLGNTFLTKQYLENSVDLLQSWDLQSIYLWSCEVGRNIELIDTLSGLTGTGVYISRSKISRECPIISSDKEKTISLEALIGKEQLQRWDGSLAYVDGLQVELFDGINFDGLIQRQQEETIYFDDDYITDAGGNHETWSTRSYGEIQAYTTGINTWETRSDDRVRIWINGEAAQNWSTDHSSNFANNNFGWEDVVATDLVAGQWYSIKIEFAENTDVSRLKLAHKADRSFVDELRFNTKAPIFQSAATSNDGTKVVLTYDEALSYEEASDWVDAPNTGTSSTTATTSDFAVTTDGAANAVTAVAVSGATVELTLTNTIRKNQTVAVSYTDPNLGSSLNNNDVNAIQGIQGNDAASITNKAVTNNSVINANGVTIAQTGTNDGSGNLLTTEAGGTSTFTVVLNAQPTADVTVSLTGNDATEGSLSTNTLTFTAANWNTAQTITITGVDDSIVDGDITTTLTATANNAGGYAGTESDTTTVKNTDNETSGVTITQTGTNDGSGNLLTTEAGGTSTFTVVLNAQPTADVTVSLTGNDATEGSLSTNTLTFTATNWNTAQTITITGVDDSIVDGDITTTLTATANNAGGYAGTESDTTTVKNTDNDTSGVTITQTGTNDGSGNLLTTEAGGTSTFTVVLNAQPTADVTVSLTGNDATEGSLSTNTLTFTAANWNTAQTITITGVDDSIVDGDITTTLTATANNAGGYAGTESDTTTVKNTDNDTSGVTITQTGTNDGSGNLLTTEAGGTSTFTVVLNAQPTADVTVSLTGNDATEGSLSTNTLTFTAANWNTAQTITITGVDDSIVDGDITTTLTATANNAGGYAGTESDTTTVKNTDNDTSGVTITQTGTNDGSGNLLTTEAGGTSTFTVVLNAQPTADVTVSLTGNDATEGSLSTNTLTFTAANWNTAQTITITGVDDSIVDGDITTTLTATANNAGGYAGTETSTVTVKNIDDDKAPSPSPSPSPSPTPETKTPGVTITQTGTTDDDDNLLTTEEGSSSGFTVVLDDQPSSNVTVSLSGNDSSEGSLSTDTLTFTPRNWKTPQHVSVTGVDDSIVDGDITTTITATANNAGGYAGTETSTVTIKNKDDDKAPSPLPLPTPEINIDETDDNNEPVSVVETDSINRAQKNKTNTLPDINEFLMQNKTDEILTHSSSHNNTNNEPVTTLSADILTNYSTSELPIIAINDYSLLGDSGGSGENPKSKVDGESSQEKGVKIITNSFVTASDDNFIENETSTVDVFYVVLTGAPSDDVQVTLEVPNLFRGSLSKEKFIFTPENWNTPQKVSFKQEFFGGQSKEENFKIRALASESGGYTGSEQDAAIVNVSKPKKQVQKVLSSIKQTKNSPDKDPTNLDIERITTREEISPIFSILRVIYFPIIALGLTLGSLKIFQRNHSDPIQSKGQIKNQQVSHLFQKELITVEHFDWTPNQQLPPTMNNDRHFLNDYSSFQDQISQPIDHSYL